jgi:two-component system response regulator PilR (NtrC family)
MYFGILIGDSLEMQGVYSLIRRVRDSKINCMILGESGVGKEMVARAIHFSGARKEESFITINCGAIPENLVESELFGHKKGAFTSAFRDKIGLLEIADQGTIFLDEIDSLPLSTQVKLLRVIQEKKITPVGGVQEIEVDVRVLCATNADIDNEVQEGNFREDLYYRLNVVEIFIPPLRAHREDITFLIEHFLERFSTEYNKTIIGLAPAALEKIEAWHFPGNVRELRNIVERAVALCVGNIIQLDDLPSNLMEFEALKGLPLSDEFPEEGIDLDYLLAEIEKKWLLAALRATKGKKTAAAENLRMSFRSFRYRLLKHGLGE